jgi:integrase
VNGRFSGSHFADFSPRLDAGGPERSRSRALTHEELITLFESIRNTPSFGGDNLLAIKLLLALCVRKGELLGARWEEFDLEGSVNSGPDSRVAQRAQGAGRQQRVRVPQTTSRSPASRGARGQRHAEPINLAPFGTECLRQSVLLRLRRFGIHWQHKTPAHTGCQ